MDSKLTSALRAEEKREIARRLVREREHRRLNGNGAARPNGAATDGGYDDLPPAHYDFDYHPNAMALWARSNGAEQAYFRVHDGVAADTTIIDGRSYLNFTNYNYLGLAGHPAVAAAVADAVARYGTSVSASRMVGGERPLHRELETTFADILDVEDCLSFVSGYSTNTFTLSYLFGPKDLILYDALIHNSVMVGATQSGARRIAFRHNDWQAVDDLLARHRRDYERVVIVVEGLYSMDGDFPDLPRFVEIRNRYKTFLMVDEAHSMGVMGARGFGIRQHFGLDGKDVDIWMGTLSKSFASCGGYIAGCRSLILSLRYGAPGFIFSAGLTPGNTAAALAAITVMKAEPERVKRLQDRGRFFLASARAHGLSVGNASGYALVPVMTGTTVKSVAMTQAMFRRGINVQPILYPAVEEKGGRLRFFVSSEHSEAQIEQTIQIAAEEWRKLEAS
ncbi:MAG TPA: aminotransferase class I/II-fold pyridoxal phosphate-dependent enzyme [Stellaceae bacterium]|nr:aminotransferase class I/II-fold pyridoxal phosphate-dependent enzyme [Stellaceae bacterium]